MKTIKDHMDYEWLNHPHCRFIEREELRRSAIEDINELKKIIERGKSYHSYLRRRITPHNDVEGQDARAKINYIMEKFNLTEEDLK